MPAAAASDIRFQLAQIAHQQNHFEQPRDIDLGLRRNFDHHRVAAPFLRHQIAIGELPLDAFGLRAGNVNFIDGHDNGNFRGPRVIDGFFGLRHHAVIGRNDENDDVGDLRTPRTHACERFVARRIDENDAPIVDAHFVRANVLRDPAGFSGGDIGFANGVEQTRLAMIDVAHNGDNRRPRRKIAGSFFVLGFFLHHLLLEGNDLDNAVKGFGKLRRSLHVKRLIDAGKHALIHQRLQQFLRANVEFLRKLADGNAFGHDHGTRLALHRRGHSFRLRGTARPNARTRAHRMQFPLALSKSLFDQRPSTRRRRFTRIKRLARFSFARRRGSA